MKGIILAGGRGSRLYPLTQYISKQLLPVYEKPMIYYPLTTLMLGGVNDIAIISTPNDLRQYKKLLGNGQKWGLKFTYIQQEEPLGLADAFIIAKDFIGNSDVSLVLGDNIFYGNLRLSETFSNFSGGALIFGYPVKDPERYGIVEFDDDGNIIDIEEKPHEPKSRYAVPGLYLYDNKVVEYVENLIPSNRGELEITDLNKIYLQKNTLKIQLWGRGIAWLDTGTSESLQDASAFIQSIEKRQSYKIGCPEEVSKVMKFITINQFKELIDNMPDCEYRDYLNGIIPG